jgi:PAS domain S-box-containing protein
MQDDGSESGARPGSTPPDGVFRRIVEALPEAVLLVDARGGVSYANRAAERVLSYPRADLVGRPAEMLVPPRLRGGPRDLRSREPGGPREVVALRRDGTEIALLAAPLDDATGGCLLTTAADTSAASAVDARVRVAVEASPHGMIMVDPAGRIVLVNREIERMFGYAREELLGQLVEVLVPTPQRGHHPTLRRTFDADPHSRPMGAGRDLHARRKDGVEFPVEIGLTPIETDQGRSVLASVIDIGPRKMAEEELRRSNHELEQFAYVASHDLQEPLRTVASFVQLLARRYRDRLDADGLEFIDFAVGGVTRMQRLIEDLLRFSRVGMRPATLVAVDAGAAVGAAQGNLLAAIEESGATVESGPLPVVLADPGQLEQLFTNLVGNALKFRGAEPPRVRVDAERDGRWWRFGVSDNGIGIEAQYFQRIFVIFQRLHARDAYPGTGVGLAICKKIVERHGGRIWVESSPGAGASFFFTLPGVPE